MAALDLLDTAFEFGTKLIDKIFPDKIAQEAERAKAQLALLSLQQTGEIEKLKTQLSAILAEANSSDPWTSRARPSFLYVMYVMILFSIPMGVLSVFNATAAAAIASGMKMWLAAIPSELYTLFGVGYVGYAVTRSYDKVKGTSK